MKKGLYKTTIVIWTEKNPSLCDLVGLAQSAMEGNAYCSQQLVTYVEAPLKDKDFDNTEFFGDMED